MSTELEVRLFAALRRIADYMPPEKLRRVSGKRYGLEGDEAIEMAYENVLAEAKAAIKGVRRPSAKPPEPPPAAPGGPAGARRPDENSPSGPSDRALNPQPEEVEHDRGAR